VVVGNPPYGDYFTGTEKNFLLLHYSKSFSGTFDMYILFFEKALDILKSNGMLSFITPNTFIDYSQFSKLRELLIHGNNVQQVIELTKVFEDAIVDTAIIQLRKDSLQAPFFKGKIFKEKITDIQITDIAILDAGNLEVSGFTIKNTQGFDVRKFTQKFSHKLSDVLKITQGITTGGNECFIGKKQYFLENNIPESVFHKVLKGKTINRYQINFDDDYIIYSVKGVDKNDQIKIEKLLNPFKDKLSRKRETQQGKLPWYCLHWSRNEKDFNVPKILIRQTANRILGVMDEDNYYPIDSIHTLNLINTSIDCERELKYLLGIINSNLFLYLYRWKMDEDGTVYPQVKKVNIEWMPIVLFSTSEKLSFAVDQKNSYLFKKSEARLKFFKYLKSKSQDITEKHKLLNWQELEFGDFIKEFSRSIVKTCSKNISKSEEMEWMEIFEEKKSEIESFQSEINRIDAEIDRLVYELYELTEEEIKIVEGGDE